MIQNIDIQYVLKLYYRNIIFRIFVSDNLLLLCNDIIKKDISTNNLNKVFFLILYKLKIRKIIYLLIKRTQSIPCTLKPLYSI